MAEYRLSQRADIDLLDIFIFGIDQFGPSQSETYQHDMTNVFRLLAETPRMGRLAESIGEGVRRHEHGSHTMLYEETLFGVFILAVVHNTSVSRLKI